MSYKRVVAIVPAAGHGRRLGLKKKKAFVSLGGRPLVSYALRALENSPVIDDIIIASEKKAIKDFKSLIKRYGFKKVSALIKGGSVRQESVRNCLEAVPRDTKIVLIHDAARPFLTGKMIADSVKFAGKFGACVTAVPEYDTVKLAGKKFFVKKTLDRRTIFRAQTPQSFRYAVLKKAYDRRGSSKSIFTDDSAMAECAGARVKILPGTYRNIKITTAEDLKLAEVLL